MNSPPSLAQLQTSIERSPFNRWLGIRLTSLDDLGVELAITTRPEFMGHAARGAMHGGVLSSLVDVGGSIAILAKTGRNLVTVDLRTDYHRSSVDAELCIAATVVKLGRQLATSDVRIYDRQRTLIASGRIVGMHSEPAP